MCDKDIFYAIHKNIQAWSKVINSYKMVLKHWNFLLPDDRSHALKTYLQNNVINDYTWQEVIPKINDALTSQQVNIFKNTSPSQMTEKNYVLHMLKNANDTKKRLEAYLVSD